MNNIDNILKNYFEGTASTEEEKMLKTYFRSGNIECRHQVYQPLFAAFEKEKQIAAPAFEIPNENSAKKINFRKWGMAVASAAAVILLTVTFFPRNNHLETQEEYVVIVNGKKIIDSQQAKDYADKMFAQADKIINESYQPLIEAKTIQKEMDANKIFNDVSQKINHIKNIN